MSNVTPIRPGAPAAAPINNPKSRGRPKGTISLRTERRKRAAAETQQSPYHPSVDLKPPQKGRFHYPKEFLVQKCICKNSYGWILPSLGASALSNHKVVMSVPNFISPLDRLLSQLEAEGHDVEGARLEFRAMREIITTYLDVSQKLQFVRPTETGESLRNAAWDINFDGYR